jgi:4-amino-4-deoxy-L-arabinose transferase-like glycosyltransferase
MKKQKFSPWFYFWILAISNLFLSYFPLSMEVKFLIGLAGILIPLWALFKNHSLASSTSPKNEEFLSSPPSWLWGLLLLLALGLRFYKLTTLSVWPLYDEGMYGYYASELSKDWSWKFLYGSSQAPPLYLWFLAWIFKVFGVSLFSLWLLPALLSLFLFPASYWAARGLLNRSFSFLIALLFGFSFWPLYVGRFSLMTGLVLLAECLVLGLLARFWKTPPVAASKKTALILGLVTGLGFYTYLHWPVLAAMVFVTFLFWAWNHRNRGGFSFLPWFLFPGLIAVLPLGLGLWCEGWDQLLFYLKHLSAGQAPSLGEQLGISFSYIASLFWGMDLKFHTYQPVWGGYLNPILGAFFFLGLLETFRRRRESLPFWLLSGLVLFVLPGALTSERATSRMILVFPILALLVVFGIKRLWDTKSSRPVLFLGLAFLSMGLDFYHLGLAYPKIWESMDNWKAYEKSYSRYQAFMELDKIRREEGPGYVLADFVPGLADETLDVACFDFNLASNPGLIPGLSPWVAILANVNLQPFLNRRFAGAKSYWISKSLGNPDGGWMLWVAPARSFPPEVLGRWRAASRSLKFFEEQSLCYVPGESWTPLIDALQKDYGFFKEDPFLQTCFWDKMADVQLKEAISSSPSPGSTALAGSIGSLQMALSKGYPAAHLDMKLGDLFFQLKNFSQARRYYEGALKAPLNFTEAQAYLKMLPSNPESGVP